jgi:hypothetical protein
MATSSSKRPEHERGVMASKAERIRQDDLCLRLTSPQGYIVQITGWVGGLEVDRGREGACAQGLNADDCLKGACTTHQMPGHGLGGTDRHTVGILSQSLPYGACFSRVADWCSRGMRVDIRNILGSYLGTFQASFMHCAAPAPSGSGAVRWIASEVAA